MVRILRSSAANQTGLSRHEPQMVSIALADRLLDRDDIVASGGVRGWVDVVLALLRPASDTIPELIHFLRKKRLYALRVRFRKLLFERQRAMRPHRQRIRISNCR